MPFVEIAVESGQAPNKCIWTFKLFLLPVDLIENVIHNEAKPAQPRKIRYAVGGRIGSRHDP